MAHLVVHSDEVLLVHPASKHGLCFVTFTFKLVFNFSFFIDIVTFSFQDITLCSGSNHIIAAFAKGTSCSCTASSPNLSHLLLLLFLLLPFSTFTFISTFTFLAALALLG